MTPAQEKLLRSIDSRVANIERHMRKEQASEHWLTPEEAEKLTRWKPGTLRKKYYEGKIRCQFTNGRKPKYLKEELEQFLQQQLWQQNF